MSSQINRLVLKVEKILKDKYFYQEISKVNNDAFFSSPNSFFYINNYLSKINLKKKHNLNQEIKGIRNLINHQRNNGSFDEWYINENSFCASAYTGYYLSKLNYQIDGSNYMIKKSLKRLNNFLKSRSCKTNLNQELAKFAFQFYLLKKYNKKSLQLLLKRTLHPDTYEYDGIDLGYLSVNLMILSDLLTIKFNNTLYKIFSIQLQQYSHLTNKFSDFSNYIFSRSSRLLMISGFVFALKKKLISQNSFTNIIKNYKKILNIYILRKDKKYLSFFYSADFSILTPIIKKKYKKEKKLIITEKYLSKYFINYKINNKNIYIYLKNANIFAKGDKGIKYFFDRNLNYNNNKLVPKKNQKIIFLKNKIILKNYFMKISQISKFKKYFKFLTPVNKLIKIGEIIKKLGRYLLIEHKKVSNIKCIKTISVKKNLIKVKEIFIVKSNEFNKYFSLSLDNKQFYFSPTSFIDKSDIGKIKNQRIKSLKRLKYNVFVREYECL